MGDYYGVSDAGGDNDDAIDDDGKLQNFVMTVVSEVVVTVCCYRWANVLDRCTGRNYCASAEVRVSK